MPHLLRNSKNPLFNEVVVEPFDDKDLVRVVN